MTRTIRQYCNANPAPKHHQKAGEKVAISSPPLSAGWAWNPDKETTRALSRGTRKIRKAKLAAQNPEMEDSKMATKKAKGKKSTKKTTAKKVAKKTTSNLTPLKKICQDLKIDPKLARRKLRAANLKGHDTQSRWEFTQAQVKKAKEILAA